MGFAVERTPPADTSLAGDTPAEHLDNLYQMLSYRVLAGDGFRTTRPGLPVGPTVDDNDPSTAADDRWTYKRAIPATRLLATPPADPADPYVAVGADTQITVDFDFVDIYGNRSVLAAPPANLALPTRYVDSLVGVNQWPGFNEHYRFQRKDDTTVTLHVDLGLAVAHFVPAADVPPDEIQRRVDAGVEAYRTVVHQLSRADVTITLRTSLMADAHTLPRAEIAQCTAEIYAFLRTLQAARPHRHTPNRASLVLVAAAFHVGVGDLAAANQRTPDLFGVGATLTIPTADPGEYTTQPGDIARRRRRQRRRLRGRPRRRQSERPPGRRRGHPRADGTGQRAGRHRRHPARRPRRRPRQPPSARPVACRCPF
ncbi:MAG: hypothetical protein R2873_35275 [Caldilineaceae bacterium]